MDIISDICSWHIFCHIFWHLANLLKYWYVFYMVVEVLRSGARMSRDRPLDLRWPDTLANHKISNAEERVPVLHLAMKCRHHWMPSFAMCGGWKIRGSYVYIDIIDPVFSASKGGTGLGSIGFKSPGFICWKGTWSRHSSYPTKQSIWIHLACVFSKPWSLRW